jgi:alpha-tubulin suppressor-like RCC1 family protein
VRFAAVLVLCACAPRSAAPVELAAGFSIAVGTVHTCTTDEQGVLRCSGANDQGELGDGTRVDRLEPVVIGGLGPVARVSGDRRICALLTNGEVSCWGDPSWGTNGDGTSQRREVPSKVLMLPPVVALTSGSNRNCALTQEGALFCWGLDPELDGIRDERSVSLPEHVDVPPLVEIGVGFSHSCGRTREGKVVCWGHANWGQLGDGTTKDRALAAEVAGVSDAVELAIGDFHSCARVADGSVQCWGRDMQSDCEQMRFHELHVICPNAQAVPDVADAVQVVAGGSHACARTSDARVLCWGANGEGQLGTAPHDFPVPALELPTLAGATTIAAGAWRTCGRMPDESIRCVGRTFIGRDEHGVRTELIGVAAKPD